MVQSDGAGIDREEQALVAQVLVELVARDAGLHAAVHVGLAYLDDAGHARQVERDAAAHRRHVAFQRGAGAPGHHRHMLGVAQREQARRFVGRLDECHGIGQHRRLGVLAMRVVLAQRGVGGDAVAQEFAGGCDHGVDGFWHRWSSGVLLAGLRQRGHAGKPCSTNVLEVEQLRPSPASPSRPTGPPGDKLGLVACGVDAVRIALAPRETLALVGNFRLRQVGHGTVDHGTPCRGHRGGSPVGGSGCKGQD